MGLPKCRRRGFRPIGGIIGPNLGGWIVSEYSWRYIFYINLPIGIVLISLIAILLHDGKVSSKPDIDFAGAAFFFGAILFLMLRLNYLAENFSVFSLFSAALLLGVSAFFLYLFSRQEKKAPHPILDMALLKSKPFFAANLFNMIVGAGVFGIFSFIPLYAISVQKLTILASGMILTPRSIGTIAASALTSFMLRRWGYHRPMVLGMILISLSTILLDDQEFQLFRLLGIHLGATESLLILNLVTGIGLGILLPASNNACIELMPEKVAIITGLRGMFRSMGGVCGISLITIILHLSATPARGFRVVFIGFGLGLLLAIPLVFLMPSGRKLGDQRLPLEFTAK